MKWQKAANKEVVDAVVATFGDCSQHSYDRLTQLTYQDWARSYYWLDASGMALYFLDQVQRLGIENALPTATLQRLLQNLSDNQVRSNDMFGHFIEINRTFQQAGVTYSNLKGFTLAAASCADPTLRSQLDLDFLVDASQLTLCVQCLTEAGYTLTKKSKGVWDFKGGSSDPAKIEDLYKPTQQRSVELHFSPSADENALPMRDRRLERCISVTYRGVTFPALSAGDLFVGQALHLLNHLRTASTRPSWLLEYKRHMSTRYNDWEFWNEVRECSQSHPNAPLAIGLVTTLCLEIFGGEAPRQLDWTLDHLPAAVRLWVEQYGRRAMLADFPGSKLYLLLESQLPCHDRRPRRKGILTALPANRAARVVHVAKGVSLWERIRTEVYQMRFIFFRIRFHLRQSLPYLVELSRWRRQLEAMKCDTPQPLEVTSQQTKV